MQPVPPLFRRLASRRRFWLELAGILLVTITQPGCNVVLLLGYLIGGPPSIAPDFDEKTKHSLADKGKKTLVLCYAPTELKWDNEAVDHELAKHVAYRLNMNKIKVIDPDRVHNWLDKNSDWSKPAELGKEFDVDYVVYIDMKEYSLFEEHSSNLYRGRTQAIVSVIKMDEDHKDGRVIYSKDLVSRYPISTPKSVDEIPYAQFKKLYLSRLSEEVGQLFYEHFAGDEVPHRVL